MDVKDFEIDESLIEGFEVVGFRVPKLGEYIFDTGSNLIVQSKFDSICAHRLVLRTEKKWVIPTLLSDIGLKAKFADDIKGIDDGTCTVIEDKLDGYDGTDSSASYRDSDGVWWRYCKVLK